MASDGFSGSAEQSCQMLLMLTCGHTNYQKLTFYIIKMLAKYITYILQNIQLSFGVMFLYLSTHMKSYALGNQFLQDCCYCIL